MMDSGVDGELEQNLGLAQDNKNGETDGQVDHGDPYQLVYDVKEEDSSDSEPNSGKLCNRSSPHQSQGDNPLLAYLPGETVSKELETSSISSASEKRSSSPRSTPDVSTVDQVDGKSDTIMTEKEASAVVTEDKETIAKKAFDTSTVPPIQPTDNDTKETVGTVQSQNTSSSTLPASTSLEQYEPAFIYRGVIYLGSTTVNAPISEVEANRKIAILKMHSDAAQAIPINLLVPTMSTGRVVLKDPEQDQPLAMFQVKTILFCVRGRAPDLLDCFAFNVRHKTSGIFHCHVFQCENQQEVSSLSTLHFNHA